MLKHVGGDVTKFLAVTASFLADPDDFYAADSRHCLAKFNQHFPRWLAKPPAAPARRAYGELD